MPAAIRVSGIGMTVARGEDPQDSEERAHRLQAALPRSASPVRLFHPIEEVAFLAAHEALTGAGRSAPISDEDVGIALGVEEGIDGIKARYYEGVLRDGPLGASPMAFPLTTPNTVAARISILLDLRGESVTLCGGSLSGGHALGAAVQAIRGGYSRGMLAGGTTAVEEAFLDALRRTHPSRPGELGCGACLFFLEPGTADGLADSAGYLLGYAEGFGAASLPDAIRGSLDDAGILPEAIGSVWTASMQEWPAVVDAVRRAGVRADVEQSRWRSLHAASFPLTVGGALGWSAGTRRAPVLVVGNDCLVGAAAAVIRGGV